MGHVRLRITVRESPSTGDHEVCLFGDDDDLVDIFGDKSIGLDPGDLLSTPCSLVADTTPREVRIARCDCGVVGCGDVFVSVVADSEIVTWTGLFGSSAIRTFDASAYHTEVTRALSDHSWETPDRTTARLVSESVDREALSRFGLQFLWASGRAEARLFTAALLLEPGPYQLLVHVPPQDLPPERLAASIVNLLRASPETWPHVEWLPQSRGLPAPHLTGPGWKRHRFAGD
jgi:hypothetical protein